ncbi:MAG TPA: hypothetical protein VF610_05230 [Segetibacter sp.]|jgi:hypothetical protein
MKTIYTILFVLCAFAAKSQKVDSIYFNLYTDSLKKGVHNYINVIGKMSNGSFLPLMADELVFVSSFGKWEGNSLIIDRTSSVDSIKITASLKARPEVVKSIVVHLKKIEIEPPLKTEKELLEEWKRKGKKD